jgi:DNA-binding NarL/FixJ family response regulator
MIRVLVIDGSTLSASVWSQAMCREEDIYLVGSVTRERDVLEILRDCDLVLLNVNTLKERAIHLTRKISVTCPQIKVLPINLPKSVDIVLKFIEAGAAGFVFSDESFDEVICWIQAVARGEAYITPEIAPALMARLTELWSIYSKSHSNETVFHQLTRREQQVLKLVEQGLSNQEIADWLVIEVGTVKNHIHHIFKKLKLTKRQEAAAYLSSSFIS